MKVPWTLEDCRVIYYVPLPEPDWNGPEEPESHFLALVECPMSKVKDFFSFGLDRDAICIWSTEWWYETVADFEASVKKAWGDLRLYRPGEEMPDRP